MVATNLEMTHGEDAREDAPSSAEIRLKVKQPRSDPVAGTRSEHRRAARLKCGLNVRLAKQTAHTTHERGDKPPRRFDATLRETCGDKTASPHHRGEKSRHANGATVPSCTSSVIAGCSHGRQAIDFSRADPLRIKKSLPKLVLATVVHESLAPMPEISEVTDVPEEEAVVVPGSDADLERFFLKVGCTKEDALTTKHLQWGWKELGKEDGAALAFVIRNNATCITLDLFVNEIYEQAGALLGRALKDNVKLKTLDLQQAQIGVEGGRAIAEASSATRAPHPLPEASTHPYPRPLPGASHKRYAHEPQALLQLPRPGRH